MDSALDLMLTTVRGYIDGFFALLPTVLLAGLIFGLIVTFAVTVKLPVNAIFRSRGQADLGFLLAGFVKWSIIFAGLLIVATIVFPSIKPANLLGTLGIGSVAIGFAFKDILQNWLSGLLILYRQPFLAGDQIVSGNFEGIVEKIEPRATIIRTYDGQRVVIPNSDIYTRAVTVRTAFAVRRSQYDVGIGYGDDIDRACGIIEAAVRTIGMVARDPPPEAVPWELDQFSIKIRVFWWSDSRRLDIVRTRGQVVRSIRVALADAGIDIPFPTRQILLHDQTEQTDGERARQREGWPASLDGDPPARHLNDIALTADGTDNTRQKSRT